MFLGDWIYGEKTQVIRAATCMHDADRATAGWPENIVVKYKGLGLYRRRKGCSSQNWEKCSSNHDLQYDFIEISTEPEIVSEYREHLTCV